MAKVGRPKKVDYEVEKEAESPAFKCPFKKGKVYCDMKIVDIVPDSIRPVHYKIARRGRIVERGVVKSGDSADAPVLKDPLTGKVIWGDYIHMMTVDDFVRHMEGKRKVQKDVE